MRTKKELALDFVRAWNKFLYNFEYEWYKKVNWHCNLEHIESKLRNYQDERGTEDGIVYFFMNLDTQNEEAMISYIVDNYREFQKIEL